MDQLELNLSCQEKSQSVRLLLDGLNIHQDRLQKLQEVFKQELESGLIHGLSGSSLQGPILQNIFDQ